MTSVCPQTAELQRFRKPDGGLYGPPLGPALTALIGDNLDPLPILRAILYGVREISIPGAIGVGVPYLAKFLPGHVGFKPLTSFEQMDEVKWPHFSRGPKSHCARVVVVGKHPGRTEEAIHYCFVGESGHELRRSLILQGNEHFLDTAYFTNLCRFMPPQGKMKQAWVKECAWFLWAELCIIKPKLVILLGSEAIKHFHGKSASVTKTRGTVIPFALNAPDGDMSVDTFGTMHPAAVVREPSMRPGLASDLSRCANLLDGVIRQQIPLQYEKEDCILRTPPRVREYVDKAIADGKTKFAVDCEWSGKSVWSGGKLLTVQISHGPGHAVLIPIHRHPRLPHPPADEKDSTWTVFKSPHVVIVSKPDVLTAVARKHETVGVEGVVAYREIDSEGKPRFERPVEVLDEIIPNFCEADLQTVVELLCKLFHRPGVRVGGHSFRADFPWLKQLGVDLTEQFLRGFDTMLRHHLLFEGARQDLSSLVLKYTDVDRYDLKIQEWIDAKAVAKDKGFGGVPEGVLYPYALRDADVSYRIETAIDSEYQNNRKEDRRALGQLAADELRSCLGVLEIEETGLKVDRDRIRELATIYACKRDELVDALREKIKWPEFNPRSVFQCRELLFGEELNGKKRPNPMIPVRQRPEGAHCCELEPIKTTGKPSMDWAQVVARGTEKEYSPSTDKETLGILGAVAPAANTLRKIRFVDQVCKNFTSLPTIDPDTGEVTEGGLEQHIDLDGRIRTIILQILETGRWASRRPNLQNIPKRREKELHAMFPEGSSPKKIRSVFMAEDGHVLVEADYIQAELVVLALLSGDEKFYNVLMSKDKIPVLVDVETKEPYRWLHPDWTRNAKVTEGDVVPAGGVLGHYRERDGTWKLFSTAVQTVVEMRPWPRDLHAERAISGFRMPYTAVVHGPPKGYVESIAKDKRVAAKTVNFGIPYGRSAPAIQRELTQDGVKIATEECQAMIDGFHAEFERVHIFLLNCRSSVRAPEYLVNPFGRRRRFERIDDQTRMAAQEREACNFPIQSTVADCLNLAVFNCWHHRNYLQRRGINIRFRIALGVHDALIFEVPVDCVPYMMADGGFIDHCMSKIARIPLPDLEVCHGIYANVNRDRFPYAIGVDKSMCLRWDETPDKDVLLKMGVSEEYV